MLWGRRQWQRWPGQRTNNIFASMPSRSTGVCVAKSLVHDSRRRHRYRACGAACWRTSRKSCSQLFPLCGTAHAVAALAAIEAALRIEVSPAQLAFRELMLLAEHGAALGWRILMDWPPLLGASRRCAPAPTSAAPLPPLARSRRVRSWTRIGGARLRLDRDGLHRAVSALARMLVDLFPQAADPGAVMERVGV